jgi:hypothetical protein
VDGTGRRCIGLDVRWEFAQVAIWHAGQVRRAGTFATTPGGVREFAAVLGAADEVALEATGHTWAIAGVLASRAGRVVVSTPAKTRAIAEAKVKTGKADAAILAQLLAAGFLPLVWMPDAAASALRRQVLRRAHIVRQRTRLKNQVHAILARNLVPRCPASTPRSRCRSSRRSVTSPGSALPNGWWPAVGSTRGSASPAGSPPATAGSPRPAGRKPGGCWSRRPGPPQGTRPAARVLPAGPGPPWHASRRGRHRPQARRAVLAPDHQR